MTAKKRKMTQAAALRKARELWGDKGWAEFNARALTAAARAKLRGQLAEAQAQANELRTKLVEARKLFGGDSPERAAAFAAWDAAEIGRRTLIGRLTGYRCSLGTLYTIPGLGTGRLVRGQGDSWEEALERATRA